MYFSRLSGAPVGKVRLELSYNPETSMVGVRLHEHTLTENRTGDSHGTLLGGPVKAGSAIFNLSLGCIYNNIAPSYIVDFRGRRATYACICIYFAALSLHIDLTVQTYLYSRVSLDSKECQQNIISFKKTDYSHTLVASFTCDSNITDLSLQVMPPHIS